MSYQQSEECLAKCGDHQEEDNFEVITTVERDKHGFYFYDVGVFANGEFEVRETVYEGVGPSDSPEGLVLCRCCQHEFVESG